MIRLAEPKQKGCSLVVFEVTIAGKVINQHVESISTNNEINRIPGARIVLSDGDETNSAFELSSEKLFSPGNTIEIKAGYDAADNQIFKGIIMQHSIRNRKYKNEGLSGSNLVLECRHELVRATLTKKNKIYQVSNESDLFNQILKPYNGDVKVQSIGLELSESTQYQQSDWAFLIENATNYGFAAIIQKEVTKIEKPGVVEKEPVVSLQYGTSILDLDAEIDAGTQVKKITHQAWNPDDQQNELADEGLDGDNQHIINSTQLKEARIYHTGEISSVAGKHIAEGQKNRRNLAKKKGRVRCGGLGSVEVGDVISLSGTGAQFDGHVLVSAIKHSLSAGQWLTDIQFGLNLKEDENYKSGRGQKTDLNGLYTGTVLKITEKGKKKEKVLIRIPALDENNGVWARMSTLDAGESRGWRFWPEVGDEVIVGFLQNDPNHPLILGTLHSEKLPSPFEAAEENNLKGFRSRNGLAMEFDDGKASIAFKTPKGNVIALTDDQQGLILSDQHSNKIILGEDGIILTSHKDVVIKAKGEVNISGQKVNLNAEREAKVEGKTGLTLASTAINTIKGNPVKIN